MGEAAVLMTLSDVYHSMKESTPSVRHAKEALAIFTELGEKLPMTEAHRAMASGYLVKTPPNTFRAAEAMVKAISIYEELGDSSKAAAAMHTLGKIELQGGDIKKAVDAFSKSKDSF